MRKTLIITLIILLGLNGFLLLKLNTLNDRFNKISDSIEKLSIANNRSKEISQINNLIFESNFKDDLVLNNFNSTIGIILGFFTILIGLGVFLSFKRIDEDITNLKETGKEVNEAKIKTEKTVKKIKETENKLTDILAIHQEKTLKNKYLEFAIISLKIQTNAEKIFVTDSNYSKILLEHVSFLRRSRDFIDELNYCIGIKYMTKFFKKINKTTDNYTIEKFDDSFYATINHTINNLCDTGELSQKSIQDIIDTLINFNSSNKAIHQKFNESTKLLINFYEEVKNNKTNQNTH